MRRTNEVDPLAVTVTARVARRTLSPQAEGQTRDRGWGEPQGGRSPGGPGCLPRRDPDGGTPTGEGSKPLERRRPFGSGDPAATRQTQEGKRRREATRSSSCQALKGEPRGRARVKQTGETARGARRRGGQEPRGRNMTRGVDAPGVVALHGWVASMGKRTSGERCAGPLRRDPARGTPGDTLERGRSLREASNRW